MSKKTTIPDEMILVPKELIEENKKAISTLEVALEDTQAKYDALLKQVYGCSSEKSSAYIQNDSNNDVDNTTLSEKRKKGNGKKNKGENGGGKEKGHGQYPRADACERLHAGAPMCCFFGRDSMSNKACPVTQERTRHPDLFGVCFRQNCFGWRGGLPTATE